MRSCCWIRFGLDCAIAAAAACLAVGLVGAAFIAVLRSDVPHLQHHMIISASFAKPPAPSLLEVAIIDAARAAGIPADWLRRTAWLESGNDLDAVGAAGECGPFQLHPDYFHSACDVGTIDDQALEAAMLLARYREQFGDDFKRVRLAYRRGR